MTVSPVGPEHKNCRPTKHHWTVATVIIIIIIIIIVLHHYYYYFLWSLECFGM